MADNNITDAKQAPPPAQTGTDDNRRRTRSQTRNGGITSPASVVEPRGRKRASQSQPGSASKRGRKPASEHSKQENKDLPPAAEANKQQPVEEEKDELAKPISRDSDKEVEQSKIDEDVAESKVDQPGKDEVVVGKKNGEQPKQDRQQSVDTNADEDKDKMTKKDQPEDEQLPKPSDEQKQSEETKPTDYQSKSDEHKSPAESKQPGEQTEELKEIKEQSSNEEPIKQDDSPKQTDTSKPANEEKQPPKDGKQLDREPSHESEVKAEGKKEKTAVETSESGDQDAPSAQAIST